MLIVGLTGGVGCGKSAAAELFAHRGVPILDADLITRELTEPGTQALAHIVAEFGDVLLSSDGRLNRRELRRIVFERPQARKRLEAILHPLVREEILARAEPLSAPYCIVVIPLLVESGMSDLVDRVLVVNCEEAQQIARVTARDECSAQEVRAIMATQSTCEARLAAADDVIENTGELKDIDRDVERLHRQYRGLADKRARGA
jgi:dephospho-CoA kinase